MLIDVLTVDITQNDTTICEEIVWFCWLVVHKVIPSGSNNSQLPGTLNNGLVGYWPFNGNANDESGNGNDGIINGAILTTARNGNPNEAFNFSGQSGVESPSIKVLDNSSLNFPTQGQFSLSVWMNPKNSQSGNIVLKNAHYGIQWNGVSNSISYYDNEIPYYNSTKNNWNLNQWYLLTLVHTGTKISLYIDGAFDSEYFNNYSPNIQGSAIVYDLYFGYEVQWGYFIGDIDDVALWNRALSAQEIQQLYTGSTNYSYSWSPSGETTSSINVLPNTTSNYTVDITSGTTTCQSDVTISVNQRDIVSIDSTYCDSIQWDGNWLASTGTYVDTLQNVAGCDSIVILNLTINASPAVDLGNDTNLCANATIDLDAGSGFTYLWQDGSIGSSLTASTSGTYDVTITDANGCIASDTINVNVLSPLSIKESTAVTCYGLSDGTASATVSGGLPPYSYLWVDNGQTYNTPNATNLPAGTYTFVITDSIGCTFTDSVTITEPTQLTASVQDHLLLQTLLMLENTIINTFISILDNLIF